MERFEAAKDAKEFLIGRIVAEAQRQAIPLDQVETKIMYFSETAWTLPDIMEVNEAFERDYDSEAYEQKIRSLVSGLKAHAPKEEREALQQAVSVLSREDHYLLVLMSEPTASRDDFFKRTLFLVILGLTLAVVGFVVVYRFF